MIDQREGQYISRFDEVANIKHINYIIELRFTKDPIFMATWRQLIWPKLHQHMLDTLELGIAEYKNSVKTQG